MDILFRDNVDVKRVRTKNGECEKNLNLIFYININFFFENFTEIIKSEHFKTDFQYRKVWFPKICIYLKREMCTHP